MKLRSLVVLFIIFLTYRSWFSFSGTLSSGDWPYLFAENIKEFSFFPQPDFLWLAVYYQILTKFFVQYIGFSWEVVERVFWFWPFVLLSVISSYYLTKSWIGVLIYSTNTYILMLVGGGQMGIAMAYSIAPFVLKKFIDFANLNINLIQVKSIMLPKSIVLGFSLAILAMFDPRIAYIFIIAVIIYASFAILSIKNNLLHSAYFLIGIFVIPLCISVLFNSYWVVPMLFGNLSQRYQGLGSNAGFEFLSFADFSHALSLLHPNWPENIFGKVYFLQPEFLVIPLIAFLSLFFITSVKAENKRNILYFSFLVILGTFLAKGVNAPFGEINMWLFEHIPGMSMFRDASKFYLLIALGYSFIIPFSLRSIAKKMPLGKLIPFVFIFFWFIIIRQAIVEEIGGTFKSRSIPREYIEFKEYVISQPQGSKSLWIPSRQRFGFSSDSHVGISAFDFFGSSDPLVMATLVRNDKDKTIYNKL
ncbi:MAG: hypothetical protein Q8P26_04290, partial [Candidatus Levybacteria bacterium]|nr:hypothetical protein [Candidatus Levybacteria bacterium]